MGKIVKKESTAEIATATDDGGLFSSVLSPEEAARSGAAVRRFVSLSGDGSKAIRGIYMGEGAPHAFVDETTGESRTVRTVEIAAHKSRAIRAVILAPAGLWSQLASVPIGHDVQIVRDGLVRTRKGFLASSWTVYDFGAADGDGPLFDR